MYYSNKLFSLRDIFGTDNLALGDNCIIVDGKRLPILNDVIILLEPSKWPDSVKKRIPPYGIPHEPHLGFAEDIQFTFGEEWKKYPNILAEHQGEFRLYFDLVDLESLKNLRVCDLGCGIGRWSYFLQDKCRELVLVDFSEAIFVARQNFQKFDNVIFIMADINHLGLRDKFADFIICLGVLHHLPVDALDMTRRLKQYTDVLLIYLYYSLDNRPDYYRFLFKIVTRIRLLLSRIKNKFFRSIFTELFSVFVYARLIIFGNIISVFILSQPIPIYDGYKDKTLNRIRQDVYDRFFTSIEQRFSRKEIMTLKDTFECIIVSESPPYWHFLCNKSA
jgi:SAM-dependent methyltransferase